MRKLLWLLLLAPCFGQTFSNIALQNSPGNYARVLPFATITLCAASDTGVPCINKVTTYTTDTLSVACTLSASSGTIPGKPTSGTGCNNPGSADANGNFTIYAAAGSNNGQYRLCVAGRTTFCQEVSLGGGGGGCSNVGTGPCTLTSVFGTPPIPPPVGQSALSWDAAGNPVFSVNGSTYAQPCLITIGCPTNGLNFPITGFTAPVGANTSLGPAPGTNGNNPVIWTQNGNGTYDTWLGIDTFCDNTNGPPCPAGANSAGTPTIYKRTNFNDTGITPQSGKNAFVSMSHDFSRTQVANGNQNRTLALESINPSNDTGTYYGMYGLSSELTMTGTPVFSGHPDGDVTTLMASIGDNHTGVVSSPHFGMSGLRILAAREGTGTWGSCPSGGCIAGATIVAQNVNNATFAGSFMTGLNVQVDDIVGGTASMNGAGIVILNPTATGNNRLNGENIGLLIFDYGTNANDWAQENVANASEGGKTFMDGASFVNHVRTTGPNRSVLNPTCSSTGTGGSPSCAVDTGSSDQAGTITVTAGTSPSATGTIVLTYNATYGANSTTCIFMPMNGTGSWNGRVSFIAGTMNTTSATVNWDNNSVGLTGTSTYKAQYMCEGK